MPLTILSVFLTVSTLVGLWLSLRQIGRVEAGRASVPAEFIESVSFDDHIKAADYTVAKQKLAIVEAFWHLTATLAWLYFGIAVLEGLIGASVATPVLAGTCLILAMSLGSAVIDLPLGLAKTFGVEAKFGFNRSTPKLFALDWVKETALSLALAAPLGYGLLWLVSHLAGLWWLSAWAGFLLFSCTLMVVYPIWIAPLFNKFNPLPEGAARSRIEALLAKAGYKSGGLFVMDGSKRSSHANAYFTGFGQTKRIVFYDTLLEKLSVDEIEAVLAHELGHFKHRDVVWSMVRLAGMSLAVFFWLGVAVNQPWFTVWMGLPPSNAVAIIVAMIGMGPIGLLLAPIANWMSWRAEWRADAFAVSLTGTGEHLSAALVKISKNSASTLTPDPLYARFHYSHPPLPLRLSRLR